MILSRAVLTIVLGVLLTYYLIQSLTCYILRYTMADFPVTEHFKAAVETFMNTTRTMCQGKNKSPAWFHDWSKHLTTFLTVTSATIKSLEEENVKLDSKIKVQATVSDRLVFDFDLILWILN